MLLNIFKLKNLSLSLLRAIFDMMKEISEIINQKSFSAEDLVMLLNSNDSDKDILFSKSREIKEEVSGKKVYFRGLIEFSNICSKNCLYCGIRKNNKEIIRYNATDQEVLDVCRLAWEKQFGSVVLQSGEIESKAFAKRVDNLIKKIKQLSNNELGITLSCGEQSKETYRRWFESGAHRYLLRIESSNRELYNKIHPDFPEHSYERRLEALKFIKETGYQVGTGVMIGFPFQTIENLAEDLLFFKKIDIDMCGMGPYVEHEHTPLYRFRHLLISKQERLSLSLKMIAALRLLMPDINIAASTALQAIDTAGREKALAIGANVIMPNITPLKYRKEYILYEGKPCTDEDSEQSIAFLESKIKKAGIEIGYSEWGDSKHFFSRK